MLVFGGLFGLHWFCVAGDVVVYVWVGLVGCLCGGFGGFCTVLFGCGFLCFLGCGFGWWFYGGC